MSVKQKQTHNDRKEACGCQVEGASGRAGRACGASRWKLSRAGGRSSRAPAGHTALHSMPRAEPRWKLRSRQPEEVLCLHCVCGVGPSAFCALLLCCSSCCCFAFFIILNTVLLFPLLFTGDSYSYLLIRYLTLDFPSGAVIEKIACQCRNPRRQEFSPWIGKIPWRRKWQPTPVFLPGESHGQRSLAGYGHVVTKSQTQRSMHMTGYFRNLAC